MKPTHPWLKDDKFLMNSADSKTAKAVKNYLAKQKKQAGQAPESADRRLFSVEAMHPDAVKALQLILAASDHLEEEPESADVNSLLENYRILLAEGFSETLEALLQSEPMMLGRLKIEDLDLITCTEANIGRWIDSQSVDDPAKKKTQASDLRAIATKEPERALTSALATWCCKSADVKQLRKLVPLVAADLACDSKLRLLELVMLRDKDGDFITHWLRTSAAHLSPTAERIRANPKLLRHAIDSIPRWFRHSSAKELPPLFMEVVSDYPQTSGKRRGEVSGTILTLTGALIPILDQSQVATSLVQELQKVSLEVCKSAADTQDRYRTWAPIQSGNHTLSDDQESGVSPDQAKQLGFAVIRARKGKDALTELESVYVNLGGTRFGEVGETVPYDATIHNDMVGGLLPGDPVTIVRSGLRFGNAGIVKADVRANEPS